MERDKKYIKRKEYYRKRVHQVIRTIELGWDSVAQNSLYLFALELGRESAVGEEGISSIRNVNTRNTGVRRIMKSLGLCKTWNAQTHSMRQKKHSDGICVPKVQHEKLGKSFSGVHDKDFGRGACYFITSYSRVYGCLHVRLRNYRFSPFSSLCIAQSRHATRIDLI